MFYANPTKCSKQLSSRRNIFACSWHLQVTTNEVFKCILKAKNDLSNHLLIFDALKTEFRKSKLSINPNCINKC